MIKFLGDFKYKKLILTILVSIALTIIIKEGITNRQEGKISEDSKIINSIQEDTDTSEIQEDSTLEKPSEEEKKYNEAYSSFFQGEYKQTIDIANSMIGEYPNSYKAYNIRGIAKAFDVGFNEGMEDIDKALEINSEYGYARYNKAFCYELYGEFDKALVWYDKALEVEEYMWSYYGKASIYGRRGDVQNTVLYLKKAIEAEDCSEGEESGIKAEARKEKDFDPVRNDIRFQEIIR